jgi:type II secretory pathway pseudopilin PulG
MKRLHPPSNSRGAQSFGAARSARGGRAPSGFTIIEIAICLGIIGFALVAIIAALPRGLDVQKRNRQETIVGQDAEVWMNLLRSGARGDDDLTNYVMVITNSWTTYDSNLKPTDSGFDYYTFTNSKRTSLNPAAGDFPITNGAHIIGLLSMPQRISLTGSQGYIPFPVDAPYQSNHVVAYVRAFSGPVVDKPPQNNGSIVGDAFTYRMVVENFAYAPLDTNAFCLDCAAAVGLTADQMAERTNLLHTVSMLRANANDFRLLFRWPVLPNGEIPNYGRATFRAMAEGSLLQSNEQGTAQSIYFVQPSTFTNTLEK